MRLIPISHIKQKIFQKLFCQNQLVDHFPLLPQRCRSTLGPGTSLLGAGEVGGTSSGMDGDQGRPNRGL